MEPETETLYICVNMGDDILTERYLTIERDESNNITGAFLDEKQLSKDQAAMLVNLLLD